MKPKFVSYENIDEFVSQQQKQGKQWFWDGWTVNIFTPKPRARTHKNGRFHAGQWGFIKEVQPTLKGKWVFDRKHLGDPNGA